MYPFRNVTDTLYYFKTNDTIEYNVRFKPSPYVFGNEVIFAPYVYELIIELELGSKKPQGIDKAIPWTIRDILVHFYNKTSNHNVCLYICDSSDGKQMARARSLNIGLI